MPKKKQRKTISVSICLDLEKKLREVAKSEGRSMSHIIERSVAEAFEKRENQSTLTLDKLAEDNRQLRADFLVMRKVLEMRTGQLVWNEVKARLGDIPETHMNSPIVLDTIESIQEQFEEQDIDNFDFAAEQVAEDLASGEVNIEEV